MTEKINKSSNTYVRKVDKVKITSADDITICITYDIIDVTVTRKRNTKGFSDIEKIDKPPLERQENAKRGQAETFSRSTANNQALL